MNAKNDYSIRSFVATTQGLSASRWLAFILASHPDVFVAHGHFPLDSAFWNHFKEERRKGGIQSLNGGDIERFYRDRSLLQVFAAYHALKPDALAAGNVHSYTLDALMRRTENPAELDGITVVNILRHPVSYLDSHFAFVRSAEDYPQLYQHYVQNVFSDAVRRFPELFLFDCANYREFLAFAVSCLSVCNMEYDFNHAHFRNFQHYRMEALTTDAKMLQGFCETLTGLQYPLEGLELSIQEGPINRHRHGVASTDPRVIYSAWPGWMKDMACMMIPDTLLDRFEEHGYDVDMLREAASVQASMEPRAAVPCLADRLKVMDEHHPLLALLTTAKVAEPKLCETDYHGYNLIEFAGRIYALACTLGTVNLPTLPAETLHRYQQRGDCFIASSVDEVKETLLAVTKLNPKLVESDFHGFNLVEFGGQCFALSCSLGPIDLKVVPKEELEEFRKRGDCFTGESIDEVRTLVARDRSMNPVLLEEEFIGFNLVEFEGQVYGLACSLGPVDLAGFSRDTLTEYVARGECFIGANVEIVKDQIIMALQIQPVLLEEGYSGFNIVEYATRFYALACSLGPVNLAEVAPEVLNECKKRGECFVANTREEVKRSVDQTFEAVSDSEL